MQNGTSCDGAQLFQKQSFLATDPPPSNTCLRFQYITCLSLCQVVFENIFINFRQAFWIFRNWIFAVKNRPSLCEKGDFSCCNFAIYPRQPQEQPLFVQMMRIARMTNQMKSSLSKRLHKQFIDNILFHMSFERRFRHSDIILCASRKVVTQLSVIESAFKNAYAASTLPAGISSSAPHFLQTM